MGSSRPPSASPTRGPEAITPLLRQAGQRARGAALDQGETLAVDSLRRRILGQSHGPMRVGRYEIRRELASGGSGVVFEAHDPELDRDVAIKLLHTPLVQTDDNGSASSSLLEEARAMARLSHPNVVPVYDVGVHAQDEHDSVYLVMELVRGATLYDWLREPHGWREIVAVFTAAGRGLAAAHAHGLVHRDFKPQNVLLGSDGRPRVADFGLAGLDVARSKRQQVDDERTDSGSDARPDFVVGTPRYMAPEQLAGAPVEAAADQFAFCVALYEGLVGHPPFGPGRRAGDTPVVPAPPRGSPVPSALVRILRRGLAHRPRDRYASMEELLARLEARLKLRRRVATSSVIGGLLLVAGSFAGQLWRERSRAETVCEGARSEVSALWDRSTRDAVEQAFVATEHPSTARMWEITDRRMSRFVTRLADAQGRICQATVVESQEALDVLERGLACLERHRIAARETIATLSVADHGLVGRAPELLGELPDPEPCITSSTSGPKMLDVEAQAEVDQGIARAALRRASGDHAGAVELAERARARAEALGDGEALARALIELGRAKLPLDATAAETHLRQAHVEAERVGSDLVAASALITLMSSLADDARRHNEVEQLAAQARAKLDRVGAGASLRARFAVARGISAAYAQKWDAAEEILRPVLEMQPGEREGLRRAQILSSLSTAREVAGDYEIAERLATEARAIVGDLFGAQHPHYGAITLNLATHMLVVGRFDRALELALEAERIFAGSMSQEDWRRTWARAIEAMARWRLGEQAAGQQILEAAMEHLRAHFDPDHPRVIGLLSELGAAQRARGHLLGAHATLRECERQETEAFGPTSLRVADCLQWLGWTELDRGDPETAVAVFDRSVDILTADEEIHAALPAHLYALACARWHTTDVSGAMEALNRADRVVQDHPGLELDAQALAGLRRRIAGGAAAETPIDIPPWMQCPPREPEQAPGLGPRPGTP